MKTAISTLFALCILLAHGSCERAYVVNDGDFETIYVRNQGADMPVYLRGNTASNVVLLIVHGGPGGNGLEYRSGLYAESLEEDYLLAYWDQRGQGMSQGHYTPEDVTIETLTDDMVAVVKTLQAKYPSASLIALGHSWGGTLGTHFMVSGNNQQLLKGWIEADGAHDIPKLNRDAVRMFIAEAQTQIALGNHVSDWQGILDWASAIDTNQITLEQGNEINDYAGQVEEWLAEDGFLAPVEDGGYYSSPLTDPTNPIISNIVGNRTNDQLTAVEFLSMTDQLNRITIPTLILWGKYDFVVPPTLGYDAFNLISSTDKKLVIFNESGHSPMDDEWALFTVEVKAFLEAHK